MLNKVILMGRLVADPELKQTTNNISVCRFSIAINRPFVPKDGGERQSDFINIVVWRNTAEFVSKYFTKGKMIIVEGTLRNNNYTDKDGVKHYSLEVHADNVSFGGDKKSDDTSAEQKPKQQEQQSKADVPDFDLSEFEVLDGDAPF